jgi:hypothetical protein
MNIRTISGELISSARLPKISFFDIISIDRHSFANRIELFFKSRFAKKINFQQETGFSETRQSPFKKYTRKFKNNMKGISKFVVLAVAAVILVVAGRGLLRSNTIGSDTSSKVEVMGAKKEVDINKEFEFPLLEEGEELTKIKFVIEKAELRDEIVVKGQKATSVKGRTFLILNLKITNEYSEAIEIYTKNYIRLSVNGNRDEWLAPDIHNDPVEVQAISTKYTRVGFPINETDSDMALRIGEISGDKEDLQLDIN